MNRNNSKHSVASALAIALLSGCLDFEAVTRPDQISHPALINLSATFAGRSAGAAGGAHITRVNARVMPGIDAQGPRQVLADTLWIGDRAVVPMADVDGARYYSTEWWGDGDSEIQFRLPMIGRVGEGPSSVSWRPVRRVDPDTVRLMRGGDLVLRLSSSRSPQAQSQDSWTLSLWGRDGGVNLSSRGLPPDSLVIPATMIATVLREPTGRIHAILNAHQLHFSDYRGDLHLQTEFTSNLSWVVEMVNAGEAR